jgi:hypothetical protein
MPSVHGKGFQAPRAARMNIERPGTGRSLY